MSATLQPYTAFEDNLKPALLMLDVYRLLITEDGPKDTHEIVDALRRLVGCDDDEELLFLHSEMFVGLIRERAAVSKGRLKPKFLCNLLRQSTVCAVTALETFLPALLTAELSRAISLTDRDFLSGKARASAWMKEIQFTVNDVLEIWQIDREQMADRLANKIISYSGYRYLSSPSGVEITGSLLQLEDPWQALADHLGRTVEDLRQTLKAAFNRRNDIVHRADRTQNDPAGLQQDITYEWAHQAVSTIEVVCRSLNTLVGRKLDELAADRDVVE